mmetsp:Transcript_95481/g.189249  ORF Transcript_95481/g.189249 Transcript_95481/m.189249 type:complete len:260 (+) Transcript_95481:69-848(+)
MSVMTIQRSISEEPPKIENPQRRAPMATPLAKRHTQPTPSTPYRTLPQILPSGGFASRGRSPESLRSLRDRLYSGDRAQHDPLGGQKFSTDQAAPDHINNDTQHSNLEPRSHVDVEAGPLVQPLPHAKAISVHETLGTPLLQDTQALGQQSPVLSSNTTKACFRAISVLLLGAAAALLGVTVASTVQAMCAMHAATAARPQMSLDFILRLARADNRCLGVVDVKAQSQVVLQTCSASGAQQFLLLKKATFDQGLMMLCA